MKYYPVFLNLNGRKAVVIGGGKVAERKVRFLLKAGARVEVVSPDITEHLAKLKKNGLLKHIKRRYRKGDAGNAFLVIAGTSSARTNRSIAKDAKHLINVIDTPAEGNFIAPSIVKRGALTIAISTEGISPAAAKSIRKELETLYGSEFALYLRAVEAMRRKAMNKIKDRSKRRKFLKKLASEKIFAALRKKGAPSFSKRLPLEVKK